MTLKYPHFFPVTRKCRNSETRRRIETAYQSRCMKENTEILEKLVELRQKQSDLLGYKNHATYIQEVIWRNNNLQHIWHLMSQIRCRKNHTPLNFIIYVAVENGKESWKGQILLRKFDYETTTNLENREGRASQAKRTRGTCLCDCDMNLTIIHWKGWMLT